MPWRTSWRCSAGRGKNLADGATNPQRENAVNQDQTIARWRRLLRQLQETQDHELSCTECFDQLGDYVDLELAAQPAAECLPMLRLHLVQCGVCREEYQVLLELVAMAAAGDLRPEDDLLNRAGHRRRTRHGSGGSA